MFEKQDEIIKQINNLAEVKKYKKLKGNLYLNEEYNNLLKLAEENKDDPKKIVEIRKELFLIPEFKEYIILDTNLRLFFNKIGLKITSIVSKHTCVR